MKPFAREIFGGAVALLLSFSAMPTMASSPKVCEVELRAVIDAYIAESPTKATEIRAQLLSDEVRSIPWHLKELDNQLAYARLGDAQAAQHYRESASRIDANITASGGQSSHIGSKAEAALNRLKACYLDSRSRRIPVDHLLSARSSAATEPSQPAQPLQPDQPTQCSAANTATANKAMDEIEARVVAYDDSIQKQPLTDATPILQVIMWASHEMYWVIKSHCPKSPEFAQRLAELHATFNKAHEACRKIQTRPEVCGPVKP